MVSKLTDNIDNPTLTSGKIQEKGRINIKITKYKKK